MSTEELLPIARKLAGHDPAGLTVHDRAAAHNAPDILPFARPDITDSEIEAVTDALRSGWLTTGPRTKEFERQFATYLGAGYARLFSGGFSYCPSESTCVPCHYRFIHAWATGMWMPLLPPCAALWKLTVDSEGSIEERCASDLDPPRDVRLND